MNLQYLIVHIFLTIAARQDLAKRRISPMICKSMIVIGVLIAISKSIYANNLQYLKDTFLCTLIVFALSYILFCFGFFGGGDGKILMGIATLTPTINHFVYIRYLPILAFIYAILYLTIVLLCRVIKVFIKTCSIPRLPSQPFVPYILAGYTSSLILSDYPFFRFLKLL